MAKPVTPRIIAFKTVITNPRLVKAYSEYVNSYADKSTMGRRRTARLQTIMENRLGKFQGMKPTGHNKARIPDYIITDTDLVDAFSGMLKGGEVGNVAEAKLKANSKSKTTIGQVAGRELSRAVTKNLRRSVEEETSLDDAPINVTKFLRDNASKLNSANGKRIFNALKGTHLEAEFYNKSKILQIFAQTEAGISVSNFVFPKSAFKNPPFGAAIRQNKKNSGLSLFIYLNSAIEKNLLRILSSDDIPTIVMEDTTKEFQKGIKKLGKQKFTNIKSTTTLRDTGTFVFNYKIAVPTGGSIPMSTGNIKKGRRKQSKAIGPQKIISRAAFQASVQRSVRARMPTGPVGGPPLSSEVLTWRTGIFQRSVQIRSLNHRKRLVTYLYNPIYGVHEATDRDPRELIENSIRSIVRQRFGKEYNVFKAAA